MSIRIDALDPTVNPSRDHQFPAMKDGLTVRLSVGQVLDLIIGSAPGALDTLEELAAALGDDENFATTVTNALAEKLKKDGSNVGDDTAKAAFLAAIGIEAGDEGDIFYRDADGLLVKLPKGSEGDFLRQGTAAPEWASMAPLYESAQTAFSNGNNYSFSHGLGRLPNRVEVYAVCTTSQTAIANVGDRIKLSTYGALDATNNSYGINIRETTTAVEITIASEGLTAPRTDGGVVNPLTATSFRLVVKAW